MSTPSTSSDARARALVVDDEAGIREFLVQCLRREGHEVVSCQSGAEALHHLASEHNEFDLILTDLTMPGVDGMEVIRHACALPYAPTVVVMTAYASAETAITAMKIGAYDYLTKPFRIEQIHSVLQRSLERRSLRQENKALKEQLHGVQSLDRMVARSESMKKCFEIIRRIAPSQTNVLIHGESGTGKELVARALHRLSGNPDGPFVALNCGAIPESLLESELFGHQKGAFTGATQNRKGLFVEAKGGTLFLDEIGELPLAMQPKLLRALQERKIRPVGGTAEIEIDCRIIAATNRDLEIASRAGEFREDLYFRLNVVPLVLPPLRHRKEDIPLLAQHFFERHCKKMAREDQLAGIGPEAHERLLQYEYRGNVRA